MCQYLRTFQPNYDVLKYWDIKKNINFPFGTNGKLMFFRCVDTYPLKRQTNIAGDDILIFYFYLSKKIRLDFSCEAEDSLVTSSLIFSEKQ